MTVSGEDALVARWTAHHRFTADSVLIVHSAFRHLGAAGLAPERLCAALLAGLGDATLLMPTMTWRTVNPVNPVFDARETPSHTGVLTECFRRHFATHRSLHPTHSVAGRGRLAPLLLSTHHQGSTPCAGNSPYGLARDYDCWVLLLGVGLECCTAIHHAEEVMAPDLYLNPDSAAEAYRLIGLDGAEHAMRLRRHARIPRDFPAFASRLTPGTELVLGEDFATPWMLLPMAPLLRTVFASLVADPYATVRKL